MDTDILAQHAGSGVYVEFEVIKNHDNLSLAAVDRPGRASFTIVTFSPQLGGMFVERSGVDLRGGSSIRFLPAAPESFKFEGFVGVYFKDGHIAFFRRWSPDIFEALRAAAKNTDVAPVTAAASTDVVAPEGWRPVTEEDVAALEADEAGTDVAAAEQEEEFEELRWQADLDKCIASGGGFNGMPTWETTGFGTDLWWARSAKLSICIAFRDGGDYEVRIARVGRHPPTNPESLPCLLRF